MRLLGALVNKLFFKYIDLDGLKKELVRKKIDELYTSVVIGNSSKFYEETRVFNLRNKREKISIGSGTHVRGELLIFGYGGNIEIGDNCYVGEGTRIWSGEKVTIGNNVLISHNVNIIDSDSHEIDHLLRARSFENLTRKGHPKEKGQVRTCPIEIDDYAWISYNSSILKGIRIGKGAIVAAGSVVTKNVEDFTIVAGNPAEFVRKLT